MLKLPSYQTLEKIHEGKHSLVYRALKDSRPSIFKTVSGSYPTPELTTRLKREFEITSRFENGGVIKAFELASAQNTPVLILEDFGGLALDAILQEGPLGLGQFLSLAVRLADILGVIHEKNIIHKDINPANIVWNQRLDIVKVIDFGISQELSREVKSVKNPNVLEGTLAYISPEQTGRMNRFLDYRTDFYSLGVTFYHMLAGRLPFESTDAMELVYAHIARQPPPLHELEGKVPRGVSDIVHKLMAKNVEDRYQSARGLAADLNICLVEFLETGLVNSFRPGRMDFSDRLLIPQKLYGREDTITNFLAAFERAGVGNSELMLVSGLPGIGKSALVNEVQKPIARLRGNFIAGKFDKFKKDTPYSALIQAFSALIRHLLAENEERLAHWKHEILQALGPNGRVITNVIPELELLIGSQPEIPALGPDESRNRFNLYFQFFLSVFCKQEHPLVLFLDDLQWADHASLEMMKLFLSDPDVKHLFVIGAFRSDEVDAAHGLNLILDDIKKTGTTLSSTVVRPLDVTAITALLSDCLHWDVKTTGPLAALLLKKTGGNPFFLGEFLKALYQEELLQFTPGTGWTWDIRKIEALQVTDNVVELMAAKIESLPGDCSDLLKLGSCFGSSFDLDHLVEITCISEAKIQVTLNVLLEEGLLIKLDRVYKFAHDRIQEAAYSLIPENKRISEHHRIGHLELMRANKEKPPRNLFFIVNQLNIARILIDSLGERRELARLNLWAGVKARSSAAYRPALNYLETALSLLEEKAWETDYEPTLTIYQEATSAAYLCGDYERMDELALTVIEKAHDVLDTVSVYEAKILTAIARNQLQQAVGIGLVILDGLGVSLPNRPGKLQVLLGLLSVKWVFWGKSIRKLEDISELKDPHKLAITRILSNLASSAYIAVPNLVPLIIFKLLRLYLKHGHTEFSAFAYTGYGFIHCGVLGDIDTGYKFGQLALRLLEKMNVKDGRARTLFTVQYFINGWKENLRNTLEPLRYGVRSGMETGDPEFTCHAANMYIVHAFFCGQELGELEKDTLQFKGMIGKLKQQVQLHGAGMAHQLLLNLLGLSEEPAVLKGEAYDFELMLPVHTEGGERNNIFAGHFNACILSYMFGRYDMAFNHAELVLPHVDSLLSSAYIPVLNFYSSLSQLALYQGARKSRQKKFMKTLRKNQKKLKHWAAHAPMNFEHKYQLVEAELARVQGQELKAREHYERAISGARDNQYINEEALALELFARFWLELGKDEIAALYMNKARLAFGSWGAVAKVKFLDNTYGQLGRNFPAPQELPDDMGVAAGMSMGATTASSATVGRTTSETPSGKLDLATVMKGSQAISGEIVLGNLLRKMMRIVMENAGAGVGYLILETKGRLYVEAAGEQDDEDITVLQSRPLETYESLSIAVVQFVARTKENVVLNDASHEGPFTADAHILAHKPKSILCLPILHQGNLSAILYLENNLSTGAFTADRLEILNLLSSQIAVSIDNARLYANLEGKVQERTAELRDTLDQVQDLKNKQDGDYFLTSLLINPLARNEVKSERVAVDFLVIQNKTFTYDRWQEELGGDICIAHTVILEDTPHTVFLNADAMGKSMQGAGGALVLGAVFQSIIERTRLSSFEQSQGAGTWIQLVFVELQKVFESFDGSMLVSMVLGAVNDESGVLQMINAEHPWTVLFRGGEAGFIEEGVSLYKLGAAEQDDAVHLYSIQLETGDVIIAGSDGRDDLLLAVNDDESGGARVINADETQFLKRVQEGEGDLHEIKAALLQQGPLTDDLSLLRLEYK